MSPSNVIQVGLRASNMDRSIEFYRDTLGARFIARFDGPGLAFLQVGSTRLYLDAGASSSTVYYQVDDIDAFCDGLKAKGVELTSEPHMIFKDEEGQFGDRGVEKWMAFCADPDGNTVGLVERRAT